MEPTDFELKVYSREQIADIVNDAKYAYEQKGWEGFIFTKKEVSSPFPNEALQKLLSTAADLSVIRDEIPLDGGEDKPTACVGNPTVFVGEISDEGFMYLSTLIQNADKFDSSITGELFAEAMFGDWGEAEEKARKLWKEKASLLEGVGLQRRFFLAVLTPVKYKEA